MLRKGRPVAAGAKGHDVPGGSSLDATLLAPDGEAGVTISMCRPRTLARMSYDRQTGHTVYIDPGSQMPELLHDGLFDVSQRPVNRNDNLLIWSHLREACAKVGIRVRTADYMPPPQVDGRALLYYMTGLFYEAEYEKLRTRGDVLLGSWYLSEAPIGLIPRSHDPFYNLERVTSDFRRTYTMYSLDEIGEIIPGSTSNQVQYVPFPQIHGGIIEPLWSNQERRFLAMVNSANSFPAYLCPLWHRENYSERLMALRYFGSKGLVDLYGDRWEQATAVSPVGVASVVRAFLRGDHIAARGRLSSMAAGRSIRRALRGGSCDKYNVLSGYEFALCYESCSIGGFVTQLMFDALFVGSIPVYLGAPDIADRVTSECFIDRRAFRDQKELSTFLLSLTKHQREDYREAGREYLASASFRPFTKEAFAERFIADIRDDLRAVGAT